MEKAGGQIVWLHGFPCAGKTFCGDYLETLDGWVNIDGDFPIYKGDHGPGVSYNWASAEKPFKKGTSG